MDINPFIYTRPLRAGEFLNRQSELNIILRRLLSAESSIIVGEPHVGKTSFLQCLRHAASEHEQFTNFVFSFVDAQTLGERFTANEFWRQALEPLQDPLESQLSSLSQLYQTTEDNQFGNYVLEKLFVKLEESGWRFVLLLDEFDALLSHQVLNIAEFWGGLRSLSSRLSGLTLLAASRKTIDQMDKITQPITAGSSYFNTFGEMRIIPFSEDAINELLDKGEFVGVDRAFIKKAAGGHPYLLQGAASAIWEMYQTDQKSAPLSHRYERVGWEFYRTVEAHFIDTWRNWSDANRKVVTVIGLEQIGELLEHQFALGEMMENPDDFATERNKLADAGILAQHENGEWQLASQAFVWWLADELKRNVRDDSEFNEWLRRNEIDLLLTKGEKEKLSQFAKQVVNVVGQGALTLIQGFAKGFGESLGKGVTGKKA
jgi:hypothetical protein